MPVTQRELEGARERLTGSGAYDPPPAAVRKYLALVRSPLDRAVSNTCSTLRLCHLRFKTRAVPQRSV